MAGTTVRELITKIGFDVQDAPLKRVTQSIASFKKGVSSIGAGVRGLTSSFKTLAFTGAATFTSISLLVRSFASTADSIKDASEQTGISIRNFQRLKFAAESSGVSQEGLTKGLLYFSKAVAKAKDGGKEQIKTMQAFGLSIDQVKKLRPDEQFILIAEAASKMTDVQKRNLLLSQAFGRGISAELIPFLNKGASGITELAAKAESLGLIMGDDAVNAGDKFTESLNGFWATLNGIKNAIGAAVLPVFQDMIDEFNAWLQTDEGRKELNDFIKDAADAMKEFAKAVRALIKNAPALVKRLGGLKNILKLVVGAFLAWQGLKIIGNLGLIAFGFFQIGKALFPLAAGLLPFKAAIGTFALVAAGLAAIAFEASELYDIIFVNRGAFSKNPIVRWIQNQVDIARALLQALAKKIANNFIDTVRFWYAESVNYWLRFKAFISSIWESVKTFAINAWGKTIEFFTSTFKAIKDGITEAFTSAFKAAEDAAISLAAKLIDIIPGGTSLTGGVADVISQAVKSTEPLTTSFNTATPTTAPALGTGQAAKTITNNSDYQVASNITINVESTADAQDIADKAKQAVKEQLSASLRKTRNDLQDTGLT